MKKLEILEVLEERYLNPLTDFWFHRIFGPESNKVFLIDFLNQIIKEEGLITDIQYFPSEQWGIYEKERKAVFDIFCATEIKRLTGEDMETYRKSILEYQDVRSAMDCAREEGREEGLEKGIKKGREEGFEKVIQKSLQMNIPIEVIVELTGYSKEKIISYK